MTYDPFDTNENDNSVDGNVTATDITVKNKTVGFPVVQSAPTDADLPAIDPSQLFYVEESDEYRTSVKKNSFTLDNPVQNFQISPAASEFIRDVSISSDGLLFHEVSSDKTNIYQYTLSSPFDLSTATLQTTVGSQSTNMQGISFTEDGTRFYEASANFNGSTGDIFESTLTTPNDITTRTNTSSINSQDSGMNGCEIAKGGEKLYEVAANSETIIERTLSTPKDITTATETGTAPMGDFSVSEVVLDSNGETLFESSINEGFFVSDLTTPYDITTKSNTVNIQPGEVGVADAAGLDFSPDGNRLYVADDDLTSKATEFRVGTDADKFELI